jgi:hypothetical protein
VADVMRAGVRAARAAAGSVTPVPASSVVRRHRLRVLPATVGGVAPVPVPRDGRSTVPLATDSRRGAAEADGERSPHRADAGRRPREAREHRDGARHRRQEEAARHERRHECREPAEPVEDLPEEPAGPDVEAAYPGTVERHRGDDSDVDEWADRGPARRHHRHHHHHDTAGRSPSDRDGDDGSARRRDRREDADGWTDPDERRSGVHSGAEQDRDRPERDPATAALGTDVRDLVRPPVDVDAVLAALDDLARDRSPG